MAKILDEYVPAEGMQAIAESAEVRSVYPNGTGVVPETGDAQRKDAQKARWDLFPADAWQLVLDTAHSVDQDMRADPRTIGLAVVQWFNTRRGTPLTELVMLAVIVARDLIAPADLEWPELAAEAVLPVLVFGESKYRAHGWADGMAYSRCVAPAMRHLIAIHKAKDLYARASDSGCLHSAHALCNLLFLIAYELRGLGAFNDAPKAAT